MSNILPVKSEETQKARPVTASPLLINFNDEISARLKRPVEDKKFKLASKPKEEKPLLDPLDVETSMLGKSIWTIYTGLPQLDTRLAKERASRLQELLYFCSSSPDITNAGINLNE